MVGAARSGPPAHRVTAVVTWFHPDARARELLDEALAQCQDVVVVDNTLGPGRTGMGEDLPDGVMLLRPGRNLGLAGGLNLGLAHLPPAATAVLLLDQDSRLPDDFVARLVRHLDDVSVGAVGPAPWDAEQARYLDPRTRRRSRLTDLSVIITSGMLVRREALGEVGPLREDFFLDAVDLDLCLRLRAAGWRVVQDRGVLLPHRLGSTRWHSILGVRVRATHHPSWRLYSAARNSALLSRQHLRDEPRWALTNLCLLAAWLASVCAFEPPRAQRARLFLLGLYDGWRSAPCRIAVPPKSGE